jgi:hypothetical protein
MAVAGDEAQALLGVAYRLTSVKGRITGMQPQIQPVDDAIRC